MENLFPTILLSQPQYIYIHNLHTHTNIYIYIYTYTYIYICIYDHFMNFDEYDHARQADF